MDDAVLLGISSAAAQAWIGAADDPEEEETFPVWPENWPTVTLFLTLQTQWRIVHGMGGGAWTGLDYAAAGATMDMLDVPRRERGELFAGLCLMERAALPLLNKLKDK